MVGGYHEFHRTRRLQEPSELRRVPSQFPANGGDLGRLALRFERCDQAAQPRPQFGNLERLVTRQPREIVEEPTEPS